MAQPSNHGKLCVMRCYKLFLIKAQTKSILFDLNPKKLNIRIRNKLHAFDFS